MKFISEPDHGMYEAINKGIRMATGDVIALMRMGGMSTDSAKRKKVWDEDIRVYAGYGFKPVTLTKLMKMAWKVPQFIQAKFMKKFFESHHLPLPKGAFSTSPSLLQGELHLSHQASLQ